MFRYQGGNVRFSLFSDERKGASCSLRWRRVDLSNFSVKNSGATDPTKPNCGAFSAGKKRKRNPLLCLIRLGTNYAQQDDCSSYNMYQLSVLKSPSVSVSKSTLNDGS